MSEKMPGDLALLVPFDEHEQRSRDEMRFLEAWIRGVSEQLKSQNVTKVRIVPDAGRFAEQDRGYKVCVVDTESREWFVAMTYDAIIQLGEKYGETGLVQRVIDQTCRAYLALREQARKADAADKLVLH